MSYLHCIGDIQTHISMDQLIKSTTTNANDDLTVILNNSHIVLINIKAAERFFSFNDTIFIFLLGLYLCQQKAVKDFWKSVKNWQSYCHEFGVLFIIFFFGGGDTV